jgi:hypothetical protein
MRQPDRTVRFCNDDLDYKEPNLEIDESPIFTGSLGSVSPRRDRYANMDQVATLYPKLSRYEATNWYFASTTPLTIYHIPTLSPEGELDETGNRRYMFFARETRKTFRPLHVKSQLLVYRVGLLPQFGG